MSQTILSLWPDSNPPVRILADDVPLPQLEALVVTNSGDTSIQGELNLTLAGDEVGIEINHAKIKIQLFPSGEVRFPE